MESNWLCWEPMFYYKVFNYMYIFTSHDYLFKIKVSWNNCGGLVNYCTVGTKNCYGMSYVCISQQFRMIRFVLPMCLPHSVLYNMEIEVVIERWKDE